MRAALFVTLLVCSGCFSFTEQKLEYGALPSGGSRRYYVEKVEFSPGFSRIRVGETGPEHLRREKIRKRLCQNAADVFTDDPSGAVALSITIHAYRNAAEDNGIMNADETGVAEQNALLQKMTVWSHIYEIALEAGAGADKRRVLKHVNGKGNRMEANLLAGLVGFLILPFMDELHYDGIEPFYGVIGTYDWLVEREFAEVVRAAVAEMEQKD
jgi:hypothetical protein